MTPKTAGKVAQARLMSTKEMVIRVIRGGYTRMKTVFEPFSDQFSGGFFVRKRRFPNAWPLRLRAFGRF